MYNRSQKSMSEKFVTSPDDVYIIKSSTGVLANTISVNVINNKTEEDFMISFKNIFQSWKVLKQLNEMTSRAVLFQIDNNDPLNYEDCFPYKARFKDD